MDCGWDLFTFLFGKIGLPITVRLFSLFDGLGSALVDSTHRYASSDEDSLSTSYRRSPNIFVIVVVVVLFWKYQKICIKKENKIILLQGSAPVLHFLVSLQIIEILLSQGGYMLKSEAADGHRLQTSDFSTAASLV